MNVQLLIDSVVRQTTVLIAELATSGGLRAPLAHVADQVSLDLASELERQGVSRKVSGAVIQAVGTSSAGSLTCTLDAGGGSLTIAKEALAALGPGGAIQLSTRRVESVVAGDWTLDVGVALDAVASVVIDE
jgi:hypothetical protein